MNKKFIITVLLAIVVVLTVSAQLTDWQNLTNKNFVSRIIHDDNNLYVGTKGGGIIKIDKQSGEQTVFSRADESMTDNTIQDMAIHNGALWVGTGYNGLAKIADGYIKSSTRETRETPKRPTPNDQHQLQVFVCIYWANASL